MAKTEKIHFILEQVRRMLLPAFCHRCQMR